MKNSDVKITVDGARAALAANAVALGLMAAGASVHFPSRAHQGVSEEGTIQGVRAIVRLAPTREDSVRVKQGHSPAGLTEAAKLGGGAILLLMLFGAEVRLHFGPRLDTVVTLAGICAFWRLCRRASGVALN